MRNIKMRQRLSMESRECKNTSVLLSTLHGFYSASQCERRNARIASAVLATAIPSVCLSVRLSVRPSVRDTPVLCQNDGA